MVFPHPRLDQGLTGGLLLLPRSIRYGVPLIRNPTKGQLAVLYLELLQGGGGQ